MEVPPVRILTREQYLNLARKLEPIGKVEWAAHYSPVQGHMIESDPDSARRQVRAALLNQAFERGGPFLVLAEPTLERRGAIGLVEQNGQAYRKKGGSGQ
ncbi:MAG: hypothetical protein Q8R13_05160 [bacterium]|nr:hypothetical protein [bacterium]MDZ4295798.1 hypothetical protein [Patescibacteria group bacterium]